MEEEKQLGNQTVIHYFKGQLVSDTAKHKLANY